MSCSINLTATIADIPSIRRCLFPTDDTRGGENWLHACSLSVSPTGDLIVLSHERRLVVLASKWDAPSSLHHFQTTFAGPIHDTDNVRAAVCLPVVGQSRSSHVVPDWTCLLLGFESGYVRFYTASCELLIEDQLHAEPISGIKARSQHNPRPDVAPDLHPDEIYVQYQRALAVVPGAHVFALLRLCRGELARGSLPEPLRGGLAPRKWGFAEQAAVRDAAVVGVNLHGQFDHLLAASTGAGFEARYRSSAPCSSLVLAAGARPFLGYHYALEGCAQPVFSDVAKAVASRLRSAVSGWLTGARPAERALAVAAQPPEAMGCRFGLCDLRRVAQSVVLSADHKMAAVADALGRVLLVDALRGVVLRVFKGYRDAQCAFVQVPDERHAKHRLGDRVALFLVVYSPKKGTLEVFTAQHGRKVTTFSAGKHSRLVYNNYGLMGFATTSKSRYVCQFDTLLIDGDGSIKEIVIPFHFALSETSNKQGRDIHLFKKVKSLVRSDESELVLATCAELKTSEYKLQTLHFLLAIKDLQPELLAKCVETFLLEEPNDLTVNVKLLIEFYQFINCLQADENDNRIELAEIRLNEKQLSNLQRLLDFNAIEASKPVEVKVGFTSFDFTFSEFASCFQLLQQIEVKADVEETVMFRASEFIFSKFLQNVNLAKLETQIRLVGIPPNDLFCLILYYWINRPFCSNLTLNSEMRRLYQLLEMLVSITKLEDYSETAPFWRTIRAMLANSSRPFPALTAAILCQLVSERSGTKVEEDIEVLSEENIEWTLLIGRLEDVSLLNIILSHKPTTKLSTLPELKWSKTEISLKYVLDKGKGSVSELVGRWMAVCGLSPESLVINDQLAELDDEHVSDSDEDDLPTQDLPADKVALVRADEAIEKLNILKGLFPYSLEAGMVLLNMCWEYAQAWQKDAQQLALLAAAVGCLARIPSSHVREGLCRLVWTAHLRAMFESVAKLVNKVGKLPKERLCRQDTRLADVQLPVVLATVTDFLDVYMEATQESCQKAKPKVRFEPFWENGPQPLVELALQQAPINYDLLHLHYQLSKVLQVMTQLGIKHQRPVNTLFESYMLAMFFRDFQEPGQINWKYADQRVQAARELFLKKAIVASLETVSVENGLHYTSEHAIWMEKCVQLAQLWNLNVDLLRLHETVHAYNYGFDGLGDELFGCVTNRKALGEELLKVAGRRLANFIANSPNIAQNTCAFTPAVTRYVEQQDREWTAPASLESTENLTNRSLSCLDHSQYEYKIADYLLDGLRTLIKVYEAEQN